MTVASGCHYSKLKLYRNGGCAAQQKSSLVPVHSPAAYSSVSQLALLAMSASKERERLWLYQKLSVKPPMKASAKKDPATITPTQTLMRLVRCLYAGPASAVAPVQIGRAHV